MSKSIEETYKKLTQREHVLQRGGMYLGSTEKITRETYVYDPEIQEVSLKVVEYNPGLLKIFDEILTNALDHAGRNPEEVDKIKVNISKEGTISVWNNGPGIPTDIHKEHEIHVPELLLGTLLSSSNYDDTEARTGAGTFGIGGTAANIYSKSFTIETVHKNKKYVQTFSENMSEKTKPKITSVKGEDYTKITFTPDYQRFGMEGMDQDTLSVLFKRVLDCMVCTGKNVSILLNDKKLKGNGLTDYIKYYKGLSVLAYESTNTKYNWEYAVCLGDNYDQISFVNGTNTVEGGRHTDYLTNGITSKLKAEIEKKKKLTNVKVGGIKESMVLFVSCVIPNPTFASQSKETLTTQFKDFKTKIEISDKFIEKLYKSEITERIVQISKAKEILDHKKQTDGKKKSKVIIPKLEDAIWAGTKRSNECTLILTEGDSASTFGKWGRTALKDGIEKMGIFSLKGKVVSVRDASLAQLTKNEELNNIKQILGLQSGVKYKSTDSLRYGKVLMLTDADSVTGDTPLLLKHPESGDIIVETIENLTHDFNRHGENGSKEYGNTNYLIWTETGWTEIESVMRHKVNKTIYRVLTNTGVVDVTEDHSLLKENKEEIAPKDCVVGDKLLHSFPCIFEERENGISVTEAYEMGEKFMDSENVNENVILNGSKRVKESFLKGLRMPEVMSGIGWISVKNKRKAQIIYTLCKSIGYNVVLNLRTYFPEEIALSISQMEILNDDTGDKSEITKIINLGNTEQYVYDLTTRNHHFQAGVGEMIVHNTDGSHIKGLLINMFHFWWKELLDLDFLLSMKTPIIKVTNGKKSLEFFNDQDYREYIEAGNKGIVKYYKGLGTSTSAEAKDLFKRYESLKVTYKNTKDCDTKILLAFGKEKTKSKEKSSDADKRKEWLTRYDKNSFIKMKDTNEVTYSDFIEKELVHFSIYDNQRSIPNVCDGLKPSQRKILFTLLNKPDKEIKVAQLSGYVSAETCYHHGEVSLQQAIINMAQDFIGSNNINLLEPLGSFGSRYSGKDAASPRYIFTKLNPITRVIYSKLDLELLPKQIEESKEIEPEYFLPIIPMSLVNGAIGIGTGFSTSIPMYNPRDLTKILKDLLNGREPTTELIPWYKDFKGSITKDKDNTYKCEGILKKISSKKYEITELPIGTFVTPYKDFLESLEILSDVINYTTNENTGIRFLIEFKETPEESELIKVLKLSKSISTSNMYLFNTKSVPMKYETPMEIVLYYYKERLLLYEKRRLNLINVLEREILLLSEKMRFIMGYLDEKIRLNRLKLSEVEEILIGLKFSKIDNSFNYLVNLPLVSLTKEKLDKLGNELKLKNETLVNTRNTTNKKMWEEELDDLEELL
jgi:DNA gyrase/topoisomerase IV subunit B